MDKWDLIEQAFFDGTFDAAWNESEHPREGGKFTSQGGGTGGGGEGQKSWWKTDPSNPSRKLERGEVRNPLYMGKPGSAKGKFRRRAANVIGNAALGGIKGGVIGAGAGYYPGEFLGNAAGVPLLGGGAGATIGGAAGIPIGAALGARRGWKESKARGDSKLKGEDALRKRGAAINRSPVRHHGGRVPKAKDAFGSRISGALRGAVSGAKAGRQATGQRIAGTMAGGVGGVMHGWRGAPIVPRLNNRSAALMSAKAQRR